MGIELKTKSGNITLTAPKSGGAGGSVDLSNYYTKAQTDAKIEERIDYYCHDFATQDYVDDAIANIDIPEVDLSGLATVDYVDNAVDNIDLPDVSGFVTAEYVQTSINQSLPDMTQYAKNEDIPDVSGFQTQEQVIALIEEYGGGTLPASEDGEF